MQQQHEQNTHAQNQQTVGFHSGAEQIHAEIQNRGELHGIGTPGEHGAVLQQHGDSNGTQNDIYLLRALGKQRCDQHTLQEPAKDKHDNHYKKKRDNKRQVQCLIECHAQKCSDHEHIALGQCHQTGRFVDQAVAHTYQAVNAALHQCTNNQYQHSAITPFFR